jgi:threonine aldolase
MLEAMRQSPLGDDGYGEDPTVNRLQAMAADKVGKEAAMFVPSGTMGNLCAILSHTRPGDEIIFEKDVHSYLFEAGGFARVAGCTSCTVEGHLGAPDPEVVERAIRPFDIHQPKTGLVWIENTSNRAGGTVVWPAQLAEINLVAKRHQLPFHMDGARLFNAVVAAGKPATDFTRHVDSVMFCLSKGLSAPVGSILAGPRDFIERARSHRLLLGGRMRQAGVLAAAGIVALEHMIDRLAEDHENARMLADGLVASGIGTIDVASVQTNMVYVASVDASALVAELEQRGVRCLATSDSSIRMVTHRGIQHDHIVRALGIMRQAWAQGSFSACGSKK